MEKQFIRITNKNKKGVRFSEKFDGEKLKDLKQVYSSLREDTM